MPIKGRVCHLFFVDLTHPPPAHLAHGLDVDEVVGRPLARVAVGLPLVVYVQVRQVVGLGHLEGRSELELAVV